ncbi:MAG: hypothetical protein ACOYKC_09230 [Anaerolineaceae bacterium]
MGESPSFPGKEPGTQAAALRAPSPRGEGLMERADMAVRPYMNVVRR